MPDQKELDALSAAVTKIETIERQDATRGEDKLHILSGVDAYGKPSKTYMGGLLEKLQKNITALKDDLSKDKVVAPARVAEIYEGLDDSIAILEENAKNPNTKQIPLQYRQGGIVKTKKVPGDKPYADRTDEAWATLVRDQSKAAGLMATQLKTLENDLSVKGSILEKPVDSGYAPALSLDSAANLQKYIMVATNRANNLIVDQIAKKDPVLAKMQTDASGLVAIDSKTHELVESEQALALLRQELKSAHEALVKEKKMPVASVVLAIGEAVESSAYVKGARKPEEVLPPPAPKAPEPAKPDLSKIEPNAELSKEERVQFDGAQKALAKLQQLEKIDAARPFPIMKRDKEIAAAFNEGKANAEKIIVSLADKKEASAENIAGFYNSANDMLRLLERVQNRVEEAVPPEATGRTRNTHGNSPFGGGGNDAVEKQRNKERDAIIEHNRFLNDDKKASKAMQGELRSSVTAMNVADTDLAAPLPPAILDTSKLNSAAQKARFSPTIPLDKPKSLQIYTQVALHEANAEVLLLTTDLNKVHLKIAEAAKDAAAIVKDGKIDQKAFDKLNRAMNEIKTIALGVQSQEAKGSVREVASGVLVIQMDTVSNAINNPPTIAPTVTKPKEVPPIAPKVEKPKEAPRIGANAVKAIVLASDIKSGVVPIKFEDAVADIGIQRAFEKIHSMALDMLTPDLSAVNAAKVKELQSSFKDAFTTATEKVEAIGNSKNASENDKKSARKLKNTLDIIKENAAGIDGLQLSQTQQSEHEFAGLIADHVKLVQLAWSPTDGPQGLAAAGVALKNSKIHMG